MKTFANWKTIRPPKAAFRVELQSHGLPADNVQFVAIPDEIMRDEVVTRWIINRGFPLYSAAEGMGLRENGLLKYKAAFNGVRVTDIHGPICNHTQPAIDFVSSWHQQKCETPQTRCPHFCCLPTRTIRAAGSSPAWGLGFGGGSGACSHGDLLLQ